MEGGGGVGGSFPYGNYQRNLPSLVKHRPQMTALDRFLWGQNHFSQPQILTNFGNRGALVSSSMNCDGGAINGHAEEVLTWLSSTSSPHDHTTTSLDGIFLNELQNPNWIQEINPCVVGLTREEDNSDEKVDRGRGKREKGGSSAILIKGQWTDDEDSKLKSLVEHFGERKWAQIANKMVGRIGKQCRERWHNHLRPDIKKESWSEEEEMLLVEAHMQIGNKWAEIAKRIPGRTENSIKNHWNATKRRQSSRRISKKPQPQNVKNQSTLLQDYIKAACSNIDNPSATTTPNTSTNVTPANSATTHPTPPNSNESDQDPTSVHFNLKYPDISQPTSDNSPSYLVQQTYDIDEMNFMQSVFGTHPSFGENAKGKTPLIDKPSNSIKPSGFSNINIQGFGGDVECGFYPINQFVEPNNLPTKTYPGYGEHQASHMYSDLYLSHLLDGANGFTSPDQGYQGNVNTETIMDHQPGSEADLLEMVSNSTKFSLANATDRFVF